MRVAKLEGTGHRVTIFLALVALATIGILLIPGALPAPSGWSDISSGGAGGFSTLSTNPCPNGNYASAFRVFEANARGSLPAGSNVTIQFQFEAGNYQPSDGNVTMYTPTIFAKLPISPKGNLTVTLPPSSFPIPASGWSNVNYTTYGKTLTTNVTFTKATASLTTELLALQTSAPYGLNFTMQWRWVTTPLGGTPTIGAWSPLRRNLLPVSHVNVTPLLPSRSFMTLGTTWTATVNGSTSDVKFAVEIENGSTSWPRGLHAFTAPTGNNTPFPATIPLFYTRPNVTVPGHILVHVHELCRGLLSNTLVLGVYAPSALLRFTSNLAACPTIDYNGTAYSNGTNVAVTPSPSFLPLQAPTCSGHTFTGWGESGPVIVSGLTSANATLQVTNRGGVVAHWL